MSNPDADASGKAPDFDGDFNEERARTLVANLRAEVAGLKERVTAVTAERDDFKAAAETKGADREAALAAAVKRAEDAERALALKDSGLPEDVLAEFEDYLTGTPEEVAARATKLAKRLNLTPKEEKGAADAADEDADATDEDADDVDADEDADEAPPARPTPRLTPGRGADTGTPAFDPIALAAAIRG